jgi:hypothetical protein
MDFQIEGKSKVVEWFGKWPAFHDAEIVSLELVRYGNSILKIHTWNITNQLNEKGYYVTDKHAVVSFTLIDVINLELFGFGQNVISELEIEQIEQGYRLAVKPCYGLHGFIEAKKIIVDLQPANAEFTKR